MSGDALLGVINDILDFSKIEAGKLELDIDDFDLREVVEDTAEVLAHQAHQKGIELTAWSTTACRRSCAATAAAPPGAAEPALQRGQVHRGRRGPVRAECARRPTAR